jgi:hypothetical protein
MPSIARESTAELPHFLKFCHSERSEEPPRLPALPAAPQGISIRLRYRCSLLSAYAGTSALLTLCSRRNFPTISRISS